MVFFHHLCGARTDGFLTLELIAPHDKETASGRIIGGYLILTAITFVAVEGFLFDETIGPQSMKNVVELHIRFSFPHIYKQYQLLIHMR